MKTRLHPSVLLVLWLASSVSLPHYSPEALAWLSGLTLPLLLIAWRRFLRLLRASAILVAVVVLLPLWTLPGPPLIAPLGALSPSVEGARVAALGAWRLTLMLGSLAWLLAHLRREGLLAGLFALAAPLGRWGLPVERFTLRLALVLQAVDTGGGVKLEPESFVTALKRPPARLHEPVTLEIAPVRRRDVLALGLAGACYAALLVL